MANGCRARCRPRLWRDRWSKDRASVGARHCDWQGRSAPETRRSKRTRASASPCLTRQAPDRRWQFPERSYLGSRRGQIVSCSELVSDHDAVNARSYRRLQPSRRIFDDYRFSGSSAKALESSQIRFGVRFGSLVIFPSQIEFHMIQDGSPLVYQGEIRWLGCSNYAHPVRICESS